VWVNVFLMKRKANGTLTLFEQIAYRSHIHYVLERHHELGEDLLGQPVPSSELSSLLARRHCRHTF